MIVKSNIQIQTGILALLLLITVKVFGQGDDDWRVYRPTGSTPTVKSDSQPVDLQAHRPGHISIIADPRIQSLNEKKIENPTKMNGYRVQLFFGDRSKAQELRGDFIRKYPDTKAYISYLAPNFRLRVGDFRTRLDCEKFKNEIDSSFPGSYIVKDKIELPPLGVDTAAVGFGE